MKTDTNTAEVVDLSEYRELQKIQTYIKNTKRPENPRFDASCYQFKLLGDMAYRGDVFRAIYFALNYGKAKGYRQAKAEQRQAACKE